MVFSYISTDNSYLAFTSFVANNFEVVVAPNKRFLETIFATKIVVPRPTAHVDVAMISQIINTNLKFSFTFRSFTDTFNMYSRMKVTKVIDLSSSSHTSSTPSTLTPLPRKSSSSHTSSTPSTLTPLPRKSSSSHTSSTPSTLTPLPRKSSSSHTSSTPSTITPLPRKSSSTPSTITPLPRKSSSSTLTPLPRKSSSKRFNANVEEFVPFAERCKIIAEERGSYRKVYLWGEMNTHVIASFDLVGFVSTYSFVNGREEAKFDRFYVGELSDFERGCKEIISRILLKYFEKDGLHTTGELCEITDPTVVGVHCMFDLDTIPLDEVSRRVVADEYSSDDIWESVEKPIYNREMCCGMDDAAMETIDVEQ